MTLYEDETYSMTYYTGENSGTELTGEYSFINDGEKIEFNDYWIYNTKIDEGVLFIEADEENLDGYNDYLIFEKADDAVNESVSKFLLLKIWKCDTGDGIEYLKFNEDGTLEVKCLSNDYEEWTDEEEAMEELGWYYISKRGKYLINTFSDYSGGYYSSIRKLEVSDDGSLTLSVPDWSTEVSLLGREAEEFVYIPE